MPYWVDEDTCSGGKDFLTVLLTGHRYLRILDESGAESFRSDSTTRHVNAKVKPGRYVIETDGKLRKVALTALEPRHREARPTDVAEPPRPRR